MSHTLILIAITVVVSLLAFRNESLTNKLILWPKIMNEPKEYYRLLTSGFIHADGMHLIFNMITLWFFGRMAEVYFVMAGIPVVMFPILYLAGIVAASLPSFVKNK